jgi:hypothetical protein
LARRLTKRAGTPEAKQTYQEKFFKKTFLKIFIFLSELSFKSQIAAFHDLNLSGDFQRITKKLYKGSSLCELGSTQLHQNTLQEVLQQEKFFRISFERYRQKVIQKK